MARSNQFARTDRDICNERTVDESDWGEGKNCFYGDRTAVSAVFRVEYEDGTVFTFATGTDWYVRKSFVKYSELYHGETQNLTAATFEKQDQTWRSAVLFEGKASGNIVSQQSGQVRITQQIPAIRQLVTPKGELVLDFGQNMAGFVEIRLPGMVREGEIPGSQNHPMQDYSTRDYSSEGHSVGEKSYVLTIRHAETLDRRCGNLCSHGCL